MSITLQTIASGYNLSAINANFQSLQSALNNNILWRTGSVAGEAKMDRNLDMDGNTILNLGVDLTDDGSLLTLGVADLRYYNIVGDTLEGNMNAGGYKVTNLAAPTISTDAARKQEVDTEAQFRSNADASLQAQIAGAAPIAAAERPIVQWHGQQLLNSVTVPDNQNAFSIGPQIAIAPGQTVNLGTNSYWNILGNVFEADQLYNVTANNLKTSDGAHTVSVANIDSVIKGNGQVAITSGTISGITDLAVADGGTGASTASGARTNLGAAASGANTDITSITGSAATLTTARTIQTNLGSTSAASFNGSANISPGITGTLGIANGGTGSTTAAAARTALGAFPLAGVTNGSDATTGNVGEYMIGQLSTPFGMSSNTPVNLTSVTLTAGDWDLEGIANYTISTAQAGTVSASISLASVTLDTAPGRTTSVSATFTGGITSAVCPRVRINVTTTTIVYLVGFAFFGSGTVNAVANITARRVR